MVLARGEVDLISSSWNAWRLRSDVADGTLRPIIQSGLIRHKELPDVPLMQELLADPKQKQVVEFLSSGPRSAARPSFTARCPRAHRSASRGVRCDGKRPRIRQAGGPTGLELDPTPGIEIQKISAAILATPKDIVDMAAAAEK